MKYITREFHKKENGVIVSGGISKDGLGKLIFHSGNINTFAYKQILQFYREDIDNLGERFFQQDGAEHIHLKALKMILANFSENILFRLGIMGQK